MVISNSGLLGGILFDKFIMGINISSDTSATVVYNAGGGIKHYFKVNNDALIMTYLRTPSLGNYFFLKNDICYLTMNNDTVVKWDTLGNFKQYKDAWFNGDVGITTAGAKLMIQTGSNCSAGQSTLSGGTLTVNTTAVATGDMIFLQRVSGTAAEFGFWTYTISNGVSFTVTSTDAQDDSVFNWWIIKDSP